MKTKVVVVCFGNWRDYSARGGIALHSLVLRAPERSTLEDSGRIYVSLLFAVGESDASGRGGTTRAASLRFVSVENTLLFPALSPDV